jgi:hypothetical protein
MAEEDVRQSSAVQGRTDGLVAAHLAEGVEEPEDCQNEGVLLRLAATRNAAIAVCTYSAHERHDQPFHVRIQQTRLLLILLQLLI